ncbi:MAG: hypothetical protein ACPGPF_10110, partial [Pontibacterium sp.]
MPKALNALLKHLSYRSLGLACIVLLVLGCGSPPKKGGSSSSNGSRYSISQDHGPSVHKDMSHVPDAVPRAEV